MTGFNHPVSKYEVVIHHSLILNVSMMNNLYNLIKLIGFFLLMLFVSGCFYDEGLPETISPDEEISYAFDIQPIFTTSCASCHPAVISSPDLSEGNSYNSITNGIYVVPNDTDASLLYQRILGNPSIMPPNGSLPSSEIELIRIWIVQGALNN